MGTKFCTFAVGTSIMTEESREKCSDKEAPWDLDIPHCCCVLGQGTFLSVKRLGISVCCQCSVAHLLPFQGCVAS